MQLTSIDPWSFCHCKFLKSLRYLLPKFSKSGSPEMNTAGIEISINISCGAKSSRCTWSQKNLEPLVFLWKYFKVLHFGGGIPYYPSLGVKVPLPHFLANFPAPHVDFSQPERLPASEEAQHIGPSLLLRHSPLPIATDGKWNFHFKVFLAELRKPSRMKIRVTPPVLTVLPIHLPTSRRFCKSHCIAFSLGLF